MQQRHVTWAFRDLEIDMRHMGPHQHPIVLPGRMEAWPSPWLTLGRCKNPRGQGVRGGGVPF